MVHFAKTLKVVSIAAAALAFAVGLGSAGFAATGAATYAYDALGRVLSVVYDTGMIVYYAYDANGNRTSQVINVNTLSLCLGSSAHGNPTNWGAGLWSTAASGC